MSNRKKAEQVLFSLLDAVDKTGKSKASIQEFITKMDDKSFEKWIHKLQKKEEYVPIIIENLTGIGVTVENNMEVAKKYFGYDYYQQVWTVDSTTGETYLTPEKYLIVDIPVRRQIQTLDNKIKIPEDSKHIDEMTNQPIGVSKGSSLTFPELLVITGHNTDNSILEMIKYRGGDLKAMHVMEDMIHKTGYASMDKLDTMGTEVKSTHTLGILLKGMHLDNNFSGYSNGVF